LTILVPDVSFAPLLPSSEDVVNQTSGLIGTKLGNTQIFTDDGEVVRVTAILAGPCVVVGKRTPAQHGYSAVQLGFGKAREKNVTKPQAGFFKKAGVDAPQVVRELRLSEEDVAKLELGQTLSPADIFTEGQFVDVTGTSKGRGFTGVMKRHNFAGAATDTHGTHEYKRHGGSIGQNMTPGRTLKGQGMPGQYGNERVTIQNLRVVKVIADENLVLVEGAVPGPRHGVVTVRSAIKKTKKAG
jgi:large subunit ribosomal protein L3